MGLLDTLSDPRFLGMLQAIGNSPGIAPQPASRLPLAQPNALNIIGNAAGGYLKGQQEGAQTGLLNSEAAGRNLGNFTNLQNYNLTAPFFGQKPITMKDLQSGNFDVSTMDTANKAASSGLLGGGGNNAATSSSGGLLANLVPDAVKQFFGGTSSQTAPSIPDTGPPTGAPRMNPAMIAQGPLQTAQGAPQTVTSPSAGVPVATQASAPQTQLAPVGGNLQDMYSTIPPPILKMRGFPVPDSLVNAYAAGIPMNSPAWQNLARAEALKAAGIQNGGFINSERPGGPNKTYDLNTNQWNLTSVNPNAPQGFNTTVGPNGQYGYTAAPGLVSGEAAIAGAKKGAETRAEQEVLFPGSTKGGVAGGVAGGPSPVTGAPQGNAPQQRNAAPTPQASALTGKDYVNPDSGTAVPSIRDATIPPPGGSKEKFDTGTKTVDSWQAAYNQNTLLLNRLHQLAQIYGETPTGGFTELRSEASNLLRGLHTAKGDELANAVMSAHDTANVQQSVYLGLQEVMSQLKAANQGAGGRILASEFRAYVEAALSPNLQGEALRGAITKVLGSGYRLQNMVRDFQGPGKQMGWDERTVDQFEPLWDKKNPFDNFTQYAEKEVPPFPSGNAGKLPSISGDADYAKLKSGDHYIAPDGNEYIKK